MKELNLLTKTQNTWCPGCYNFVILSAVEEALRELIRKKEIRKENIVAVTGIGCHGKIFDYLNVNGFYGLHGRVIPAAVGIKIGNPRLTVIGFGGDGDTFAEGIAHFLHACNTNPDITMVVHDNQVFALTTGQMTPTTEKEYKGPSSPEGKKTNPINPIALALASGASFVARTSVFQKDHLKDILIKAIKHRGFSFVDILQPCITFHNTSSYLKERIYDLEEKNHNPRDFKKAFNRALEWNYSLDEKSSIPIGIFWQEQRKTFEEDLCQNQKPWYLFKRNLNYKKLISLLR
ncbi:2-oxoacid:ferredoxin oxidoreductase subunit beta [bacterium]|nr:2-oxoacid:ferredoxin oxidoreductase subunit beta [bacterium]